MKSIRFFMFFTFFIQCFCACSQASDDSLHLLLQQADYWKNSKSQNRIKKRIEANEAILNFECQYGALSDSIKAKVFFQLSVSYNDLGYVNQALYYANGGVDFARKYLGLNNIENIHFLNLLAQILENHFSEVESVLQLRKEIEKIRKSIPNENLSDNLKLKIYDNLFFLSNLYVQLGNEVKFTETYDQIDELIASGLFTPLLVPFEYALFKSYGYLSFNKAKEAYQIIYSEYQKQDSLFSRTQSNVNEILIIQTVLSEVYLGLNKPDKALELYYKSNQILQQKTEGAVLYEAYIACVGAQSMTALKQYKVSEEILKNVILKLEKLRTQKQIHINSDLAELYDQRAKNQYVAYQDNGNEVMLYDAYAYSLQAQYCLKSSWQLLKNQNDLQHSLNNNYPVFETALSVLTSLYQHTDSLHYFEEALRLIELTKNVNLRANLNEEKVAKEYGVSAHLLARERAFKKQLFDLKYQLDYAKNESDKQLFQDSIHQINADFLQLQETIHRQHPNYIQKIQAQQDFDWDQLVEQLQKEKQTLVYYASGEKHLFLLSLSSSGRVFTQINIGKDSLHTLVTQLREAIYHSSHQADNEHLNQLTDLSHQLYEVLIKPIQSIASDRLLVIADGALEQLPFSILLSHIPAVGLTYNKWPFIVKQYSFSYAYAIDLLLNPAPKTTEYSKDKILAFAPDFPTGLFRGNDLRYRGQLTDNKQEVAYIEHRFSSTAFYGDQAKLSTFRDLSPDYAVLHLATHGAVDVETGGYSYLAFSPADSFDNQLNVGELYTMDIPAELVILSACETGLGEWQRGEGVIGLERAFSYAGARSVVTTHWKVSDHASASLMGYFYNELAKGLPKDKALQKAQLTFINEQETWLSHPFFWAAYVQKGDMKPLGIPLKSKSWLWYLLGLGLVGSIFIFARKK